MTNWCLSTAGNFHSSSTGFSDAPQRLNGIEKQ